MLLGKTALFVRSCWQHIDPSQLMTGMSECPPPPLANHHPPPLPQVYGPAQAHISYMDTGQETGQVATDPPQSKKIYG